MYSFWFDMTGARTHYLSYHYTSVVVVVSEWLLFNANSAIVKLYKDENKLLLNEMIIRSTFYQSLLLFLNAACSAEKQQIPIAYSSVWRNWASNPLSTTLEASTRTITPPIKNYILPIIYYDILLYSLIVCWVLFCFFGVF